ncbi:hypothetical protein AKO1_006099, partial [Acrasis kona]
MSSAVKHNTYFLCDTKHKNSNSILHTTSIVMWVNDLNKIMTVSRCRHERMDRVFYRKFFCNWIKILEEDGVNVTDFLNGLTGAIFDFSTAEAYGYLDMLVKYLGEADGTTRFWKTVKGCYVHWLRSCKRVAGRVCTTERELELFMLNCKKMSTFLQNEQETKHFFKLLSSMYPGIKPWTKWWETDADRLHIKMLVRGCSKNNKFNELPDDTNTAESINNQYRRILNVNIQLELSDMFEEDCLFYGYFFACDSQIRTSYKDRSAPKRRAEAKSRRGKRYHNDSRAPDTLHNIHALPQNEKGLVA